MNVRDLLHHGADTFGLLKRVLDDLLQVNAIAGRLRELVAVLFDLVHVEQQRGQRSVELAGDRSSRLFRRAERATESRTISRLSSRGALSFIHFEKCESPARWSAVTYN